MKLTIAIIAALAVIVVLHEGGAVTPLPGLLGALVGILIYCIEWKT